MASGVSVAEQGRTFTGRDSTGLSPSPTVLSDRMIFLMVCHIDGINGMGWNACMHGKDRKYSRWAEGIALVSYFGFFFFGVVCTM